MTNTNKTMTKVAKVFGTLALATTLFASPMVSDAKQVSGNIYTTEADAYDYEVLKVSKHSVTMLLEVHKVNKKNGYIEVRDLMNSYSPNLTVDLKNVRTKVLKKGTILVAKLDVYSANYDYITTAKLNNNIVFGKNITVIGQKVYYNSHK